MTEGSVILEWVLPAGQQDQRDCCGCHRKQRDHAGGRGPTSSGRPPDLCDQPAKRIASSLLADLWLVHGYLLLVRVLSDGVSFPVHIGITSLLCCAKRRRLVSMDITQRHL